MSRFVWLYSEAAELHLLPW